MKCKIAALFATFLSLCLCAETAFCRGVDKVYRKDSSQKTWGQIFSDFFGYSGYQHSYALIIGISDYDDYRDLPTKSDPSRVKDYLFKEAGFDYVHVLTEEKATEQRITQLMVDDFPRLIDSNDRFLLYWSGHGVTRSVGAGKRGYLPLASTPKDRYSRMVSMHDIHRWDSLLEATQTLYLLDSCFSGLAGSAPQGRLNTLTIQQLVRPSRQILTAGGEGEQTIVIDRLGGSVFTAAVLDGLRGAADTTSAYERDGVVSVNELELYIRKRVALERELSGWGKSITPQLRDLAVNEGEFFFLTSNYTSHMSNAGDKSASDVAPVPKSELDNPGLDIAIKAPVSGTIAPSPVEEMSDFPLDCELCNRLMKLAGSMPHLPSPKSMAQKDYASLVLPVFSNDANNHLNLKVNYSALQKNGLDDFDSFRLQNYKVSAWDAFFEIYEHNPSDSELRNIVNLFSAKPINVSVEGVVGDWKCKTHKLGGIGEDITSYSFFDCRIYKKG